MNNISVSTSPGATNSLFLLVPRERQGEFTEQGKVQQVQSVLQTHDNPDFDTLQSLDFLLDLNNNNHKSNNRNINDKEQKKQLILNTELGEVERFEATKRSRSYWSMDPCIKHLAFGEDQTQCWVSTEP